jgi:hypothetical protein
MSRTTRYRVIPLILAASVSLTLSAALPGQGLSSAVASTPSALVTAAPPVKVVQAAHDYASATFGDPWDYSNAADAVLDSGPTLGVSHPSMSGGVLTFTAHSGYISPIWGGYASEVPIEREGTRTGNALVARVYTRMHLNIYVSAWTGGALSWYTCGALRAACNGQMSFGLLPGWNDIDLPIVRNIASAKPWAGSIVGLRLALGVPSGTARFYIDSLRVYQPLSASAIRWAAPDASPATPATLWWTNSPGIINAVRGLHAGRVTGAVRSANASTFVNANVGAYPAGTQFWAVADGVNGAKTHVGASALAPLPVIDSPSAAGCLDYATRALGHPWTFTSTRSLAARANIGGLSFAGGVLSATNVGPRRNDPSISLPLPRSGLNGRIYHRLTIVESYDGPFNLANRPGGGTMARVLWKSAGHAVLAQTAPLVTFTGKRSITVDLGMPAGALTDRSGPASQRYPFASASPVTQLRYDPNEDPGARRWHLYSVRLAADCQATPGFKVTWHDPAFRAGSTVRLLVRTTDGRYYSLGAPAAERAGANTYVVPKPLGRGTYQVVIYVTNPDGLTTSAVSTGPLVRN